ncbi:MAG: hypothetical protein IH853_03650 [Bacteroidetes bacterium]|nr:hypothetical protein [Bacteroidota bacterium]
MLHEHAERRNPGYRISGTLMTVILPTPLAPESSVDLAVDWEVEFPERGAPRMGTDDEIFFIAYTRIPRSLSMTM